MRRFILIATAFVISSIYTFGQTGTRIDFLEEIQKYDFSKVLMPDTIIIENESISTNHVEPLGFFGNNYQRFHIHFISIIQDKDNPLFYYVYGKTKLKENVSEFQGKIIINECKILKEGDIAEYKQGYIIADYLLYENVRKNGSGNFKGKLTSYFYIDDKDALRYDALFFGADGFKNNQYEGFWISYKSGNSYKCNWGDYRIPDSNELDIGAGEFSPSKEYAKYGWASFINDRESYYRNNIIPKEEEWWE